MNNAVHIATASACITHSHASSYLFNLYMRALPKSRVPDECKTLRNNPMLFFKMPIKNKCWQNPISYVTNMTERTVCRVEHIHYRTLVFCWAKIPALDAVCICATCLIWNNCVLITVHTAIKGGSWFGVRIILWKSWLNMKRFRIWSPTIHKQEPLDEKSGMMTEQLILQWERTPTGFRPSP